MPSEQAAYLGILVLLVVTYITRCSGYVIGSRIPEGSRLYRIIQTLPGCALAAVIAPVFVRGNWLELGALAVTTAAFYWSGQMLTALLMGLTVLIAGNHLMAM